MSLTCDHLNSKVTETYIDTVTLCIRVLLSHMEQSQWLAKDQDRKSQRATKAGISDNGTIKLKINNQESQINPFSGKFKLQTTETTKMKLIKRHT